MRILTSLIGLALSGCATEPLPPTGAALFAENCAACHGTDGRGQGSYTGQLAKAPPDLTLLSQRAGGTFPMVDVLSIVDGFHRVRSVQSEMPEWGLIFSDPTVQVDLGDGVMTPVSPELLAIARYLERLQR